MKASAALRGLDGVVIDTMVFVHLFEDAPPHAALAESILSLAGSGVFGAVYTPVTVAELLVKPLRMGRPDLADRYRAALRSMPGLRLTPLGEEVGGLAAALRARYSLPLPDMLQVAAALLGRIPALVTNDKALRRVKEVRVILLDELAAG